MVFQPGFRHFKASGGGSGYSCTITAGQSGSDRGYDTTGGFGTLDKQPVPGFTLQAFANLSFIQATMEFTGNALSLFAGKTVWVNGVNYPGGSGWNFDSGYTYWDWTSGGPNFVNGNSYFVEIK